MSISNLLSELLLTLGVLGRGFGDFEVHQRPAALTFRPFAMRPPAAAAVLIVDDDVVVCEIYRLSLERAGYGVHAAADGVAGLQLVSKAKPDFIFLDIRMPKMDGIELLRRLVADPATREIPVVMMSNYDEPALINESLGLGAKEYLIKAGTDPRNLPAVVSRWVKPINSTSTGAPSQ